MGDGACGGMAPFGQKVDLCQRIKEVLANYPTSSLLKEALQNADDAGASTFAVMLDERTNGTASLCCPGTAPFQGPALLTHNDAKFTDADLESIQHIGGSRKAAEDARSKTGRFGVGFNSVYHLCDLPAFVSGQYVVMFDPQARHLPNVNPSNPGKMIDFVKYGDTLVRNHPDQFAPFRGAFGCDLRAPFDGTLFPLPLRTP